MTTKSLPPNVQAQPPHPEIAALQQVMQAIADRLPEIGAGLSTSQRPLMANALLNLSVNRILAVEGAAATASILQRLAALILGGDRPADGDGYRLNGHDA
jgi:hypothetical protein